MTSTHSDAMGRLRQTCSFIPPFLLERLAAAHRDEELIRICQGTLVIDTEVRERRRTPPGRHRRPGLPGESPEAGHDEASPPEQQPRSDTAWSIHDAENGTTLPGRTVRTAGQSESGDAAVDEAAASVTATLDFFRTVLSRSSYDDDGAEVVVTVHYGHDYDNAFWDGDQLVLGDGDGTVFVRFTGPIDVLAHEFGHAVTQHTAALSYDGQSGALNESMSDVYGSMVKQYVNAQSATDADWLIGAGIFTDSVSGVALRSMKDPGSAYDDDVLGKDPQVGSMDDYVDTADDNGGVHINSGIPNRAFYLAATTLGGSSWEQAGPIWYAAMTGGQVDAGTDFVQFAAATVAAAGSIHGAGSAQQQAVTGAWAEVGIDASADGSGDSGESGDSGDSGADQPAPAQVEVRRTGGFAGLTQAGSIAPDDPRREEVDTLLGRIDFRAVATSAPQPDRFSYVFVVGGSEVTVPEQDLTDDQRRLAELALERGQDR